MRVIENILSLDEIQDLTARSLVYRTTGDKIRFDLPVSLELKNKLQKAFNTLFEFKNNSIPLRWIKGDTKAHIDKNTSNDVGNDVFNLFKRHKWQFSYYIGQTSH
jgi:hypothetical protein